ncbi:MAG: hypothetical protein RL641_871 [Candidatus Parcubacteria bacterium]|jgi:hypothetical protein
METFIPVETTLLINPSNFFDKKNMREEFESLNSFIFKSFKVSIYIGSFSDVNKIYFAPYINGRVGYFKDSKMTEGGFIRGWNFEELMYKLCAMIIGEQKISLVSHDWKELYTILYQMRKKEIRALGHFHSDVGYATGAPKCRSCGSLWSLS